MLRQTLRNFIKPLARAGQVRYKSRDPWASTVPEEELEAARIWRSEFNFMSIDRRPATITTSRSSGPGGQHVNTTDSKVTLKYPLADLLRQIPGVLHDEIKALKYCKKGGFLSIQVGQHRKQGQNENESWTRLYEEIARIAKSLPSTAPPAQKAKVEELQKRENLARMKMKKAHSNKKQSRRSGRSGD